MNVLSLARGWRAFAIVAAVALAAPAAAQAPAPAAGQPSAAHIQLARDFLDANGSARALDNVIPSFLDQVQRQFLVTNPDLQREIADTAGALLTEFNPRRADLMTQVARVYAARFTEPELRELVAFYRTPTGRKLVTVLPTVLEESFLSMNEYGGRLSEEMVSRLRAEMRKKGHNL